MLVLFSKYWQHVLRAKHWVKNKWARIKTIHDNDVQARKEWQQQFNDKVWFPPRQDDEVTREVERIFGEFETFFEEKRRQRSDSEKSVPLIGKSPSRRRDNSV